MKLAKFILIATALASCGVADSKRRSATMPSVSIADARASEGAGQITFTVSRNSGSGSTSVTYRTIDGSARAGSDYNAASGTITFGSGETSKHLAITLHRNPEGEPTETFTVSLRAGTNARISDGTGVGTITDEADPTTPPVESTEPPPVAVDPATKFCSDGSEIPVGDSCPVADRDPLLGAPDVASEFDYNNGLLTDGGIPQSAGIDPVGAFRFICGAGQLLRDDPIVYPGTAGQNKSHLHQFYGNLSANGDSTYDSLRASGDSTCGSDGVGHAVNRSAYWMPAMLDGSGSFVRKPDYVAIYYKRRPSNDPVCSYTPGTAVTPLRSGDQRYSQGICKDLPNGLKFIFGFDMLTSQSPTGELKFNCQGPGAVPGNYQNLPQTAGKCPLGATLGAVIEAPNCWDGKNLDSANHRDHVAYASYGDWGYLKCPATHPYVIPQFTLGAWYASDGNTANWSLSSDAMFPNLPKGSTFHADFFMAWDPTVKTLWHTNCINLHLNCSGGQLGDGRRIKWADQPRYNGVASWTNPTPKVAVP